MAAADRVLAGQVEDATDIAEAHLPAPVAAAVDLDRFVFASEQAPAATQAGASAPASVAEHPAKALDKAASHAVVAYSPAFAANLAVSEVEDKAHYAVAANIAAPASVATATAAPETEAMGSVVTEIAATETAAAMVGSLARTMREGA